MEGDQVGTAGTFSEETTMAEAPTTPKTFWKAASPFSTTGHETRSVQTETCSTNWRQPSGTSWLGSQVDAFALQVVRDHGCRWNTMKMTVERQQFIILTDQRSGSNHLGDLLDSHRCVRVAGEIFNPSHQHISRNHPLPQHYRNLRTRDPIAYLNTFFSQPLDPSITHLGFRIFHDHARSRRERSIWTVLRRKKELQVIHLKRRNLLRNLLSLKLAERSNQWERLEGTPPVLYEPLRIQYEEAINHFRARERNFSHASRFFQRHRKIEIFYEDLVKQKELELNRILHFLGLPPQRLTSSTRKQNQQCIQELIENHAELKARFRKTSWRDFFKD